MISNQPKYPYEVVEQHYLVLALPDKSGLAQASETYRRQIIR